MNLSLTSATRIGLNPLALLGVAIALYLGETIFVPLTIAVLLAAILWPLVAWMNGKLRVPWTVSCFVAVGLLVALFVGVTAGFTLAVPKMLVGLPNLNNPEVQHKFYNRISQRIKAVSPVPLDRAFPEDRPDLSQPYQLLLDAMKPENLNKALGNMGRYLANWLFELVLIAFVLLFLLMEGRMLTQRIVEIFGPSAEAQSRAVGALGQIAKSVRAYLVWRTVVNIGLGLVLGVVYSAAGLEQAWTWALLAAVLCYVPYIGTVIAGVPPVLDAFVTHDNPIGALGILLFYVVVVTIEGYLIVPLVMGRSMDLNATTVLLACLFWQLVWGTPGLFLAMPLMAALKAVCMTVPGWRPWANLMGTDEEPVPLEQPLPAALAEPEAEKTLVMTEPPAKSDGKAK